MNQFLESRFSESVRRLALGIECTDALLRMRVGMPIEVSMDGIPRPRPSHQRDPGGSRWDVQSVLEVIERHDSCRHVVLLRAGIEESVAIRIRDARQRYVARRIEVELPEPIGGGRAVRPALFPAAAYPLPAGAVGMRGRIERDGAPMRWARAEARRATDDVLVGRAHGDQHGEFVLLLQPEASRGADLILPLQVRVTVFGPGTAPDPEAVEGSAIDPLWDLPMEDAAIGAGGEETLRGERLPAGYVSRPNSSREVEFGWHGLVREEFDFS
jgi:hypothetical protein